MSLGNGGASTGVPPRTGQVVLAPASADEAPSEQVRILYRLNDPALSELGLEEFLDELLVRVQEALAVDTVAILLYDEEADQLVARAAKGIEEEVEAGVRLPLGRGFAGRIAAERVAIYIADVNHADILNPILREKGIRSLLGVPLIVEGDLIGVLHVGSLTPRTFGPRDLSILQVAAARAAPGIERARLYSALEHEHTVAMVLQRSLLPTHLVDVAGISAAARYMPASYDVGGDWYDVFQLPRGRFGIVIGDVVGHGLKAAALMGQLRTALHSYAIEAHSPARTLQLVDRYMRTMVEPSMATAAYAVLEAETGVIQLASAGHLPPVIVGPDSGRIIEVAPAPPLGAFPYGTWTEQETVLAPGETILFYTDGLVERPGIPLTESINLLLEITAGASSAEHACQLAVEQLIPTGRLRDDVALVAMHYGALPDSLNIRLPAEPDVLADVRQLLRRWLHRHGVLEPDAREILLAVNEACANAIEHAYSPAPAEFELEATDDHGQLEFKVKDEGSWRAPRGEGRGRGLKLIQTAMDEVEVDRSETGTTIVMRRRVGR
ncbi:MAG TPA: SpoIIE family protein phosphatase [Solirubrobacteraceae bacterium]|nr:SpoIIE family protein phosphatase [Solirubrobacteraceae bacterium]